MGRKERRAKERQDMDLLKEFEDGKHTIKSLRDKLVEETKINLVEVQN